MIARLHSYLSTPFIDIAEAETIEITVDDRGNLWLNVDGKCCLRAMRSFKVIIDDKRGKRTERVT